jgi:hypothetical protein
MRAAGSYHRLPRSYNVNRTEHGSVELREQISLENQLIARAVALCHDSNIPKLRARPNQRRAAFEDVPCLALYFAPSYGSNSSGYLQAHSFPGGIYVNARSSRERTQLCVAKQKQGLVFLEDPCDAVRNDTPRSEPPA